MFKCIVGFKLIYVVCGEVALVHSALVQSTQFVVAKFVTGVNVVHQLMLVPEKQLRKHVKCKCLLKIKVVFMFQRLQMEFNISKVTR